MPDSEQTLTHCYNKGCGKKFDPSKNDKEDVCVYHPGPPYFHEGYKIWNCCNKKSTDFTTWLSYPGCAKGKHNPEPPPDAEKPYKPDNVTGTGELIEDFKKSSVAPKPPKAAPRRSADALEEVTIKISQQTKDAIQKKLQEKLAAEAEELGADGASVAVGTSCKNAGCSVVYDGESTTDDCWYHSGIPVFHEGCKFWSCCNRKTTDFDTFLQQEGCTSGKHAWRKPASAVSGNCRYEWYQTADQLVITIYSRNAFVDNTRVQLNSVTLQGHVTHALGEQLFNFDWPLWGSVDTSTCVCTLSPSKLEVKLKKSRPQTWPRLCYDADIDRSAGDATIGDGGDDGDDGCPDLILD